MKKVFAVAAAIMLLCMVGGSAFAGWTVVNLNPAAARYSYAVGVSGGQQVGYADVGGADHAGLWSGTAGSWVDLNPAGAIGSDAYDVSGGQQVGEASGYAGLWSGTAASWVNLNPAGAGYSAAYGVSGGQQVGEADGHAGLWSGTAASWVDLNPAGAIGGSVAYGVSGGWQVGEALFHGSGTTGHAGLWSGTAGSWVDLHALLPAGVYSGSRAESVDVCAGETWVAGWAYNDSTCKYEAMLWHYTAEPVPEPSSIVALAGGLISLLGIRRGGRRRA